MGQHVSRTDFEHSYTDEPHATRRKEILKKYPEVKSLFGPDPWLAVWIVLIVVFQITSLFLVCRLNWLQMLVLSYCVGGTLNHTLMLGIHEICHSLAFGYSYPMANKVLGMIANLPICLPMSVTFKMYHLEHHKYQGVREIDMDIPSELEAKLFCTTFGKVVWMILQPAFYTFRPLLLRPKRIIGSQIINNIVQLSFNAAVYYYFGAGTFAYLLGGSMMAMGLHPVAGHFISEHYMFNKGQETYSYYGPLNMICFNVGYHNEHHDFPFVAGSRLYKVRAMAPEYYDTLPHHESWIKVIYEFITDPSIGPYARIVREQHLCNTAAVEGTGVQVANDDTNSKAASDVHQMLNSNGHISSCAVSKKRD